MNTKQEQQKSENGKVPFYKNKLFNIIVAVLFIILSTYTKDIVQLFYSIDNDPYEYIALTAVIYLICISGSGYAVIKALAGVFREVVAREFGDIREAARRFEPLSSGAFSEDFFEKRADERLNKGYSTHVYEAVKKAGLRPWAAHRWGSMPIFSELQYFLVVRDIPADFEKRDEDLFSNDIYSKISSNGGMLTWQFFEVSQIATHGFERHGGYKDEEEAQQAFSEFKIDRIKEELFPTFSVMPYEFYTRYHTYFDDVGIDPVYPLTLASLKAALCTDVHGGVSTLRSLPWMSSPPKHHTVSALRKALSKTINSFQDPQHASAQLDRSIPNGQVSQDEEVAFYGYVSFRKISQGADPATLVIKKVPYVSLYDQNGNIKESSWEKIKKRGYSNEILAFLSHQQHDYFEQLKASISPYLREALDNDPTEGFVHGFYFPDFDNVSFLDDGLEPIMAGGSVCYPWRYLGVSRALLKDANGKDVTVFESSNWSFPAVGIAKLDSIHVKLEGRLEFRSGLPVEFYTIYPTYPSPVDEPTENEIEVKSTLLSGKSVGQNPPAYVYPSDTFIIHWKGNELSPSSTTRDNGAASVPRSDPANEDGDSFGVGENTTPTSRHGGQVRAGGDKRKLAVWRE